MFFSKKSPPASAPVPAAAIIPPPPSSPAPVFSPVPVAASVPRPAVAVAVATTAEPSDFVPRGFAPPAGRPLQREVQRLRKQLRARSYALSKQRRQSVASIVTEASAPQPEPPAPAPILAPAPTLATAPVTETPAPELVPAQATRLIEIQYEVLDLRHKLEALTGVPALDDAAITALATKAPAFTEVQYEVAELHHQVQELQKVVATLKAAMGATDAGITTSKLAILDDQGRTVASISSEGVVLCSSVVLRGNA